MILKKTELDMTQGSIVKCIVQFALPLLFGNLFQQLYNLVDTWVIGQANLNDAYAAVGSVGPIINILIGFFLGFSSGASVVISQYYGAGQLDKVKKAVHTSMLVTFIFGVFVTIVGAGSAPLFLKLMLKPEENSPEVYEAGVTYLTIYFIGALSITIYNMGAAILRAIGDSQRPFLFLVACAIANTVLDLVFVFWLGWGVAGVAIATVISQTVSAILALVAILRSQTCVRFSFKDLCLDKEVFGKIAKIGFPSAFQMAITAFSNVFVQSYIANVNGVQVYCLGGWTSYSKVDQFIFLPMQTLALSVSTFVAQNLGYGNIKRARKGALYTYYMSNICTAFLILNVLIFTKTIAAFFNADPNVVEYAIMFLRYITPFYILCNINQIFAGSLRGAGNGNAPMIIMLSCFVGVRQIYLFIMSNFISNDPLPIAFGYPVGWFACAIVTIIYYTRYKFTAKNTIANVEEKQEG